MSETSREARQIANGDYCVVLAGVHAGKAGVVEDKQPSKTGHITITVRQDYGVRVKTLPRSVERRSPG